jgi:hypothetical protein
MFFFVRSQNPLGDIVGEYHRSSPINEAWSRPFMIAPRSKSQTPSQRRGANVMAGYDLAEPRSPNERQTSAAKASQEPSSPKTFLAAVGGLLDVFSLASFAGSNHGQQQQQQQQGRLGSSSGRSSRSSSSPPRSPKSTPTGGEDLLEQQCADDEEEALAASRECVERAIDRGARSDLPPTLSLSSNMQRSSSTVSFASPSTAEGSVRSPWRSEQLEVCSECKEPISGAVFMLLDRAYCCQRHRLKAYTKSDRSGKLISVSGGPCSPTGLQAQYGTWL